MRKFFTSKVINNTKVNSQFQHLFFRQTGEKFSFEAGQFVLLKVNSTIFRAYSIASGPKSLPNWEIILDTTPNGIGCTYLKNLKVGDIIETLKPTGTLTLNNDGSDQLIAIANGCGIASMKAIIEDSLTNKQYKKIHLLWGIRYEKNIFLKKTFANWQDKFPKFSWDIILSQPEKKYQGKRGHVNHHIEKILGDNITQTSVYLCGSKEMISDTTISLKKHNFPINKIYFEKYY